MVALTTIAILVGTLIAASIAGFFLSETVRTFITLIISSIIAVANLIFSSIALFIEFSNVFPELKILFLIFITPFIIAILIKLFRR